MTTPPNASSPARFYLVDGTAQLFRAYFAIRDLTNDEGLPTNAVYGFTSMLRKLMEDERPDAIAVAFDLPGEVFRNQQYAAYKANRPPTPEDLNVQLPWAKKVCLALGVPVVERQGFEADDLIATYARQAATAGHQVTVVASDKDLLQLVEERIEVLNPTKEQRLDAAGVAESFGVPPEGVCDVLGLQGDSVDNIPGVPGVGGKTAVQMVSTYGGMEPILERATRFAAAFEARDGWLAALETLEAIEPVEAAAADGLISATATLGEALDHLLEVEGDDAYRERLREAREVVDTLAADEVQAAVGGSPKPVTKATRAAKRTFKSLDKGSQRKLWTATAEHVDQARMSRELAVLCDEVPGVEPLDTFTYVGPDVAHAVELFRTLGFRGLTKEFERELEKGGTAPAKVAVDTASEADSANASDETTAAAPLAPEAANGAEASPDAPATRGAYVTVDTVEALREAVEACRAVGRFALDTETDSTDPQRARLVGIALAWEVGKGVYVPLAHRYLGVGPQLRLEDVQEVLGPLLTDPEVRRIGQNWKYDDHVLRRHGLPVVSWSLDTMVAAFLLDSSRLSYSMDSLALDYLGHETIPYHDVVGKGAKQKTLDEIEIERVTDYAGEDADITLRLADRIEERLDEAELRELYDTIDGPVLPILARMEAWGIRVDADVLARMSNQMATDLERLRGEIHELADSEFNVDSPKQLREVLYDKLGLTTKRKTAKSGVKSTDAATLEMLRDQHPIAEKLIEYREVSKLMGTYVEALPKLIHPDSGRVHTSYNATGAATGRLSSSDPNLQNIPARTEAGRRIRAAFVPDDGFVFLASDYSQVELRVLAHMAEDEGLTEAFRAGEDIHRFTAASVFGVDPDLVTSEMRTRAKAVNFGILYGMSETRLAREQKMSRAEAHEFIEAYFARFSRVRDYIERVREDARRDAAVRTLFGRIRWFPQLHSKVNRGIQEQALRAALNTTIQGTAADLMKLAMLRVEETLRDGGWNARILLQVHDELLLEVARDDIHCVVEAVRRAMEEVHPLRVPLKVDQKSGASWLEVT